MCVDGDPICDLPDPLHDPVGALDALLAFGTKHFEYGQYMKDPAALGQGANPTGTVLLARPMAISILLNRVGVHALDDVHSYYIPLRYPELARIQPVIAFFQARGPQYPELGHGATLPDLLTIGSALRGNPVAQARLLASLRGIARYPIRFASDWTAVIRERVAAHVPTTAPVRGLATNADVPTSSTSPTVTSNAADPGPVVPRPTTPPSGGTSTGPLRTTLQQRFGDVLTRFRPSPAPSTSAKPAPSTSATPSTSTTPTTSSHTGTTTPNATPDRTATTQSPTSHSDQSSNTRDSDGGGAAAS